MVLCAAEATTKGYCVIQLGTGCAVSSPAGADHNPVGVPGAKPLKAPRILHLMVPTSGKKASWFPVYCVQDHRKIHPVQKTMKEGKFKRGEGTENRNSFSSFLGPSFTEEFHSFLLEFLDSDGYPSFH